MPTYLVESYLPEASTAAAAAAALAASSEARHRWSLVLPDEDLCLHVVDAPSAEIVRDAAVYAELACQRISQVVVIAAQTLGKEET